jgi:hypothetical protein
MGKAKPAKHTAAELAKKAKESTTNKGGGKEGLADRKGGKAGHAKYMCPICKTQAPDPKSMAAHHESKHPTLPFDAQACVNLQDVFGSTTQGVAVRGSTKKK